MGRFIASEPRVIAQEAPASGGRGEPRVEVSGPDPALQPSASMLIWGGVIVLLLTFFVVIAALMRWRAISGSAGRRPALERPAARPASSRRGQKSKKNDKGDGLFRPAGEDADITFEDAGAPDPAQSQSGGFAARAEDEAEIVIERADAAPVDQSTTLLQVDDSEARAIRRAQPFATLFARKKKVEISAASDVAASDPGNFHHGLNDAFEPTFEEDVGESVLGEADAARMLTEKLEEERRIEQTRIEAAEEMRRRAIEDARLAAEREAEVEAARLELAREASEEARRRADEADAQRRAAEREAEFERRKLTALLEQRDRDLARQAGGFDALAFKQSLVSDVAEEFDRRFAQIEARLDARASSLAAAHPSAISGEAQERLEALAQEFSAHRATISEAIDGLKVRLDAVSFPPERVGAAPSLLLSTAVAPQVQLVDIVGDVLPPAAYELNAVLTNNRKVDCLIRSSFPPGPMAIDAKFPVEAFRSLASSGAHEQELAESAFRRAALRHIIDIAERLIIPGETADSALLFLPSEAMYAAIHARFDDVVQDARRARVWIVSPTTLMATLHTMRAVMRDVHAREGAERITAEAQHVMVEVEALRQRVFTLESNFERVRQDVRDLLSSTDQVYKRAETISSTQRAISEAAARPASPPAFVPPSSAGAPSPTPVEPHRREMSSVHAASASGSAPAPVSPLSFMTPARADLNELRRAPAPPPIA